MLSSLLKRAKRKRLEHVIKCRLCTQEDLRLSDLSGKRDEGRAISNHSRRYELAVVIALDSVAVQIDPPIGLDPSAR